jgi:hypothetical protein
MSVIADRVVKTMMTFELHGLMDCAYENAETSHAQASLTDRQSSNWPPLACVLSGFDPRGPS